MHPLSMYLLYYQAYITPFCDPVLNMALNFNLWRLKSPEIIRDGFLLARGSLWISIRSRMQFGESLDPKLPLFRQRKLASSLVFEMHILRSTLLHMIQKHIFHLMKRGMHRILMWERNLTFNCRILCLLTDRSIYFILSHFLCPVRIVLFLLTVLSCTYAAS